MAITSDEDVLFHWCMMSANDLEDNQVSVLLNKIVEPWVTIRGYSFVSAWVKKASKKTIQHSTTCANNCMHLNLVLTQLNFPCVVNCINNVGDFKFI